MKKQLLFLILLLFSCETKQDEAFARLQTEYCNVQGWQGAVKRNPNSTTIIKEHTKALGKFNALKEHYKLELTEKEFIEVYSRVIIEGCKTR